MFYSLKDIKLFYHKNNGIGSNWYCINALNWSCMIMHLKKIPWIMTTNNNYKFLWIVPVFCVLQWEADSSDLWQNGSGRLPRCWVHLHRFRRLLGRGKEGPTDGKTGPWQNAFPKGHEGSHRLCRLVWFIALFLCLLLKFYL